MPRKEIRVEEGSMVRAVSDLGWWPSGPPAGGPHVPSGTVGIVRSVDQRGPEGERYFILWDMDCEERDRKYRTCNPSEVELA